LGKQPNPDSAKVEGSVFVQDAAGNQSFVAGASVKFSGPATFETESDENGRYVIAAVPSGTYSVEAIFPGLKAIREVHVEGNEVHVSLELKPTEVTASVEVKPDQADTKDPARAETISEKHCAMHPMSTSGLKAHCRSFLELFAALMDTSISKAHAVPRVVRW